MVAEPAAPVTELAPVPPRNTSRPELPSTVTAPALAPMVSFPLPAWTVAPAAAA